MNLDELNVNYNGKIILLYILDISIALLFELHSSKIISFIVGSFVFFLGYFSFKFVYSYILCRNMPEENIESAKDDSISTVGVAKDSTISQIVFAKDDLTSNAVKDPIISSAESAEDESTDGSTSKEDFNSDFLTGLSHPIEKETAFARVKTTIEFTEDAVNWIEDITLKNNKSLWFNEKETHLFFLRDLNEWKMLLIDTIQPIIQEEFRKIGWPENNLPKIVIYESRAGSLEVWYLIVIIGTLGTAYQGLKQISLDSYSLTKLIKKSIDGSSQAFYKIANEKSTKSLKSIDPSAPSCPVKVSMTIKDYHIDEIFGDINSHKIHLNVDVSSEILSIENLDETPMKIMRVGIFKSESKRDEWSFPDSYSSYLEIVPPFKKINKSIAEFKNVDESLDLSDIGPKYVDCWLEDLHGIYLFKFYFDSTGNSKNDTPTIYSHEVHLNIAISENHLIIENLSEFDMNDINLGIFKNEYRLYEWDYTESYKDHINILSPHQTLEKIISDFKKNDIHLNLANKPVYCDCWVRDQKGIYIFMFYLKEQVKAASSDLTPAPRPRSPG